jgi:uncharacterized protein YndB with AHSA1/START domain
MSSKPKSLKFRQFVKAPASEVYSAFTNATALCEWLCNVAQADPREGGRLYLWWQSGYYASGEFITLEPERRIAFSWHGRSEPGMSLVKISLKPQEGGTLVRLLHTEIDTGKAWKPAINEYNKAWPVALENLASVLETGLDLRFVSRPILGIFNYEFLDSDEAASLELKAPSALRLNGLVEGMGAKNAGLQPGDILLKLGGFKLDSPEALGQALSAHQAGDNVKASFIREGEKYKLKIELSQRPLTSVPATAEGVAEAIGKIYVPFYKALKNCLEGLPAETADYRPSEDDWNIKEIIAHLIATERDNQAWIAGLIEGKEPDLDFSPLSTTTRIRATLSAYPKMASLLDELKRSMAETIALFDALPEEFVVRKRSYWRMGYTILQENYHLEEHLDQIKANIKAYQLKAPQTSTSLEPTGG